MRLNRVMIFVGNTIKCAEFYRDTLDLKPVGEWTNIWAELDGDGCRLAFHQAYGENGKFTEATGSPRNPHKIVFTVDDVVQTRQALLDRGVAMDEIHIVEEMDGLMLCDGSDPEGHRFQICNQ